MRGLYLNREQVREVDRRAIQEYGMNGLVLMENAGRGCTDVLCRLGVSGPVVICCGSGNNAGDGFVIARHLDLRGRTVRVVLFSDPDDLQGDAAANFEIIRRSSIPVSQCRSAEDPELDRVLSDADWIIDALLGTGARGKPRPPLDQVIRRLNVGSVHRMAIDLPSGLDCDTGQPADPTFRADVTCTFVAAKQGFAAAEAAGFLGEVHVLDIGAPRRLLEECGAIAPI